MTDKIIKPINHNEDNFDKFVKNTTGAVKTIVLNPQNDDELPFIAHRVEEVSIDQRAYDGYVNTAALYKACNKNINNYFKERFHKRVFRRIK